MWKQANSKAVRTLRDELVIHGVWVNSMSRAQKYLNCLNTCLNETNLTVFTDEFTAERKALVT
jgi:hypothetical protein